MKIFAWKEFKIAVVVCGSPLNLAWVWISLAERRKWVGR